MCKLYLNVLFFLIGNCEWTKTKGTLELCYLYFVYKMFSLVQDELMCQIFTCTF